MSMFRSVLAGNKLVRVITATAAGTTAVNGSVVDMLGFSSVAFVVGFGTLTATQVTKIKVQHGDASDGSDAVDLAGSASPALADTDGTKILATEVFKPTKRYVRVVVVRGTANAVIDFGLAILGNADVAPANNTARKDATLAAVPVVLNSPAAGTA